MSNQKPVQLRMELEPDRPVHISHSKEALEFRIAQVQSIVKAGNADYYRALHNEEQYRHIAHLKGGDWGLVEGTRLTTAQAKAMLKFLSTWKSRRDWYADEIASLERSLDLLSK